VMTDHCCEAMTSRVNIGSRESSSAAYRGGTCRGARSSDFTHKGGFMDASWTGLLIAMVGVAGTPGAALLTQNRADRTKRMELEAAAEQRREERGHAEELLSAEQARQWQRENLERRRTCYITLNTEHWLTRVPDGDDQLPLRASTQRGRCHVPGETGGGQAG